MKNLVSKWKTEVLSPLDYEEMIFNDLLEILVLCGFEVSFKKFLIKQESFRKRVSKVWKILGLTTHDVML